MAQRSAYGGQAVIEGVMIRGKSRVATAVRTTDGGIIIQRGEVESITAKHPWMRLAFLRGMPALIDSMRLGFRTLMWSADLTMEAEGQEKPKPWQYAMSIVTALAIALIFFTWLPSIIQGYLFPQVEEAARQRDILSQLIPTTAALLPNTFEGIFRVVFLVGYILLIGRSGELRRVFAYHGAEHKVVNAYEAIGTDGLTVEGAKGYSRIHPRCGTSFLFLFFVIGILLHAVVGWQEVWLRLIVRLLMIPIIAGVAYELIRLAGKWRDSIFMKALVWPGLLLQRLTTAEPTDEQIEVALASMRAVLQDEGVLPREEPQFSGEAAVTPA